VYHGSNLVAEFFFFSFFFFHNCTGKQQQQQLLLFLLEVCGFFFAEAVVPDGSICTRSHGSRAHEALRVSHRRPIASFRFVPSLLRGTRRCAQLVQSAGASAGQAELEIRGLVAGATGVETETRSRSRLGTGTRGMGFLTQGCDQRVGHRHAP